MIIQVRQRRDECPAVDRVSSKMYFSHLKKHPILKKNVSVVVDLLKCTYFHCLALLSDSLFRWETSIIVLPLTQLDAFGKNSSFTLQKMGAAGLPLC